MVVSVRKYFIWTVLLVRCAACLGQSSLSLSSASGNASNSVTLNVSLSTAHPGSSAGLQWTLNAPQPDVVSFSTAAGPAATAAQKSLYCANDTCLLLGLNETALSDGVVAVVTLNLSPSASGNLAIQMSGAVEALLDGTGGPMTAGTGLVSVVSPTAVSVAVSPSAAVLSGGQSQQFSATVTGTSNSWVNWSMSPSVGNLTSAGIYTAPAVISAAQTVIVTATSVAGPTKTATATVSLQPSAPVVVSVTPSSVSLGPLQAAQFTANVSNATNKSVTWSLAPSVGTIANGLYSAPATITAAQTVEVTATSVADTTKSATATVSLIPAVSVALTPSTVSLKSSESIQFAATVANATNQSVSWSLTPAVGSIANGLYTAPSTIAAAQTIVVTAISVVDATKFATATVSLIPAVSIALTPSAVSLGPLQTAQFTATVAHATNGAVSWTLTPAVGTITNGLYTAPATITPAQMVRVTATSAADPSKSATATVSLAPPAPVIVTVAPSSVSLGPLQTAQFAATVANSANSAVTWSLTPAVGTIHHGFYIAPATITAAQSVVVTATSIADQTKAASSVVYLLPSAQGPGVPSISSVSPKSVVTGSRAFTLTIKGANFVQGSVVLWNGADRPSTFLSNTSLSARISSGDVASAGTATVMVYNPATGGVSNPADIVIDPPESPIRGVPMPHR